MKRMTKKKKNKKQMRFNYKIQDTYRFKNKNNEKILDNLKTL